MIKIQTENFSVEEETARLTLGSTKIGGIVAFVGTVRDYTQNDDVIAMVLEHYPGMTESELEKIELAARIRFQVEQIFVIHRVGRLKPGENIVLVIAAARHRAAAFDACRYMIDHLKLHATFWKKEIFKSGEERWVESCPGCEAAASQWHDTASVEHIHPPLKSTTDPTLKQPHNSQKHQSKYLDHPHHQSGWIDMKVGILTLSDSRNRNTDKSGDALAGEVRDLGGIVAERAILADEQKPIESLLCYWSDKRQLDLILTTGGTGPGPRDITPEATRAVTDRELPGFSEQIRQEGLKQVRTALLTRGVSAFRNSTLIINLPGSTRGALHSLQAIKELIPHALRMARGGGHG